MQNDHAIIKRYEELAARCEKIYSPVFTDFLDVQEQNVLIKSGVSFSGMYGGYETAERKIAVFGEEYLYGDELLLPAVWVCISPIAPKFADTLSHRDYLGALMNTGIDRAVMGDLIIHENKCFVFMLSKITEYIINELECVRHTKVKCEVIDELPTVAAPKTLEETIIAAGNRLDAVIASVYPLSRSEAVELISGGRVFINSAEITQTHRALKENDTVSVRGYGKFTFTAVTDKTTKSGKLRIIIKKYV